MKQHFHEFVFNKKNCYEYECFFLHEGLFTIYTVSNGARKGVRSLRPCGYLKLNQGPLEEQRVLLLAETSLQTCYKLFILTKHNQDPFQMHQWLHWVGKL